jgi:osmotically-inducible protein OsmY
MMYGGIGELARSRLQDSPYFSIRDIDCAYGERVLTLRGRLPSHYLKQVALAMVADVAGVRSVNNTIEVVPPVRRGTFGREVGLRC